MNWNTNSLVDELRTICNEETLGAVSGFCVNVGENLVAYYSVLVVFAFYKAYNVFISHNTYKKQIK